ncbi:rod shape-determining protein MreD [Alkalicoccus daliensis]|uniref:Rod shape-determining protein MreD n=2 Tax=Alkalicoccus daliensis TaxID=745820 RepID=A0A1H0CMV8_9BACI|nr:rod shape-determining protein MreD [Alkalicoccus daliensis]
MRFALPAVMFLLFILEGTAFQIFAPDYRGSELQFIPRFMFLLILMTGIFRGRSHGLFYAVIFGILYDIVYSPVLGVYTFGIGLLTYLFSMSTSYIKRRLGLVLLLVLMAVIGFEYYVYGMMSLLGITSLAHEAIFTTRLLPSFIMNGLVAALMVYPVRSWFYSVDGLDDR